MKFQWAKHQQRWFGKWHVYLGIIAGAIVAFVGVTGSILVFQDEIDRALNPELFTVTEQQHKMSFAEIVPLIRQKHPQLKFSYMMMEEDKPNLAYRLFNFKTEDEYFINPYTAELSGKRLHESSFIHIVTELHRTLLVPTAGRYIVGLTTLCLLILTISGLRLWIPAKWNQLRSVLTVKLNAGFKRQNYDWHNVLGFYSAPVVTLLALTGFCITFSPLVIALLFVLNGQSPQGVGSLLGAKSTYAEGVRTLPLEDIVAATQKAMPGVRIAGVAFPADSTGSYRLDVIGEGLPKSGKREMLILDQYSGKVLLNSRSDFPNSGNAYLSWLTPIHYGSFGGMPTKILALLGGLMPLVLFVTGFIIWWPRFRKQKQKVNSNAEVSDLIVLTFRYRWHYFYFSLKKGFRYAFWVVLSSIAIGALYGLPSGIVIQPAVFAIAFTCLLVVINFVVALPVWGINLLFFAPFQKGSRGIIRYFAWSFSFLVVYLTCYLLLMNTGLHLF